MVAKLLCCLLSSRSRVAVVTDRRYTVMRYEWDEAKRRSNLRKPGIDFVGCEEIFAGNTVTIENDRFTYGERRFVTLGLLEGRVVSIVHTETENVIRIISIRKATRRERIYYFESFPD